jgi:hypothetical protein
MKFINDQLRITFKGQDYNVFYNEEDNQLVIGIKKFKGEDTNVDEDMQKIFSLNEYLRLEGFFPRYYEMVD